MFHIVLVEPEIPGNTGTIGRMCVGLEMTLHLVEPLGFSLEDKYLRRAGLDYWRSLDLKIHRDWSQFINTVPDLSRVFCLSTKSEKPYWDVQFRDGDYFVFGKETKGLSDAIRKEFERNLLTIPMTGSIRSLNLSMSAGIVTYEAFRQVRRAE